VVLQYTTLQCPHSHACPVPSPTSAATLTAKATWQMWLAMPAAIPSSNGYATPANSSWTRLNLSHWSNLLARLSPACKSAGMQVECGVWCLAPAYLKATHAGKPPAAAAAAVCQVEVQHWQGLQRCVVQ
jgi:hypothetical protein